MTNKVFCDLRSWRDPAVLNRGRQWAVAERQRHGSLVAALFDDYEEAKSFADRQQLIWTADVDFEATPIDIHADTATIYYGGYEDQ